MCSIESRLEVQRHERKELGTTSTELGINEIEHGVQYTDYMHWEYGIGAMDMTANHGYNRSGEVKEP